ncbi:MAG: Clostripain family protein [Syntrophorhabdus sp. PtaU1.Bin058]|nr:MAG: Clostripain family protein [Syntrophorhabdus sp. PtaU1.Bin058]
MKKTRGSPKQWDFIVAPAPGTRLPSGGWYPPYGHIGHWEVTDKVAGEMGFSSPACDILCDAAQDPDFYDFGTVAAHAQTPDEADLCGSDSARRAEIIDRAITDYVSWIGGLFQRFVRALKNGDVRTALYWLGYLLHSVEDLAVHKGITNGEHASTKDNPDYKPGDVALSYVYARRALEAVRNGVGQEGFDSLRNHDGEGRLGFFEKRDNDIHPGGWDIDNEFSGYSAAGKKYKTINPPPEPVRWDREFVLSLVLDRLVETRLARARKTLRAAPAVSENPHRRFEVINPISPLSKAAQWTVLVYMAGDDRNPNGIEYAISQDLAEIKEVGSNDAVHFIVQTDDATGTASYRYRLRKGTDLASDRIECFNGDLNTGSTKTLVDFVRWAHILFPAERTALILWGHGSGHNDQNVYRAARGSLNPRTAARLAQRRLGFFSGTRQSILEQGPTRGYGYDDTAGDFLDNGELRKAMIQIRNILGRKLDILGFDACLMAMIEVAYQINDTANILVASELSEPGNGWWYSRAFAGLPSYPGTTPQKLAGDIVSAYKVAYKNEMTLSAIELEKIPLLAGHMASWAKAADPAVFQRARRNALDCSPRPGDGYCDLGSFLDIAGASGDKAAKEAKAARKTLRESVIASCGKSSGLTIYAPGNFRPGQAGSADALYMGLNFVRKTGWGVFLNKIYPPVKRAYGVETLPIPTPVSGLDRHNARRVLAAVRSRAKEGWIDRLRGEILGPCGDAVESLAGRIDKLDPPRHMIKSPPVEKQGKAPAEERRILILPGIMGSLLHDRSGKLGGVWIDLWNLVFGDDFDAMKLTWETGERGKTPTVPLPIVERIPDADNAVRIEAYGVVPLIYDRIALALMDVFGPVVEFSPFDWRQPVGYSGQGLVARVQSLVGKYHDIRIALVAHSMGGLVAADALTKLKTANPSVLDRIDALVVMGVPFLGSVSALEAMRAEKKGMGLLKLLGRKSAEDIEGTVQTFRGLFDMMPGDQEDLLSPAVFTPGPLSHLMPGDPRLTSPLRVVRDLPKGLTEKTRAIFCNRKRTIGSVKVREDGSVDYSNIVPGDGTVPVTSALNGNKLSHVSYEVNEGHMTLPLDGEAIDLAVDWIAQRFGMPRAGTVSRVWPKAPEIRLPESREDLIRRLEADDEMTLGDFIALMSLV